MRILIYSLFSVNFIVSIKIHFKDSSTKLRIMATQKSTKGIIAILTGGGDVPGLNPAIRAVTIRANSEGYKVIGLRRGWAGISELIQGYKSR